MTGFLRARATPSPAAPRPHAGPRPAVLRHLLIVLALAALAGPLLGADAPAGAWADEGAVGWQVRGFGTTPTEAEQSALERAEEQVSAYLLEHHGPLGWTPTAAFLRQAGMVRVVGGPSEVILERSGKVFEVRLEVHLLPVHLEEILQMARRSRVQERHQLTALLLAAVLIGLAVLSIYLRLEEASRGYYTGLLRLAALAVVGVTLAGLWWVVRT